MTFLGHLRSLPARILIFCIELYRMYVSPLRLPTCRFSPTCSEYAVEALRTHGAIKGSVLAVVRLLKCAPWHSGGWDPVPDRGAWRWHSADQCASGQTTTEENHDLVRVEEQRST